MEKSGEWIWGEYWGREMVDNQYIYAYIFMLVKGIHTHTYIYPYTYFPDTHVYIAKFLYLHVVSISSLIFDEHSSGNFYTLFVEDP